MFAKETYIARRAKLKQIKNYFFRPMDMFIKFLLLGKLEEIEAMAIYFDLVVFVWFFPFLPKVLVSVDFPFDIRLMLYLRKLYYHYR